MADVGSPDAHIVNVLNCLCYTASSGADVLESGPKSRPLEVAVGWIPEVKTRYEFREKCDLVLAYATAWLRSNF
jgi:hypothetical protein